jgi:hypothetical protein
MAERSQYEMRRIEHIRAESKSRGYRVAYVLNVWCENMKEIMV